jgi:acyl dehydratase
MAKIGPLGLEVGQRARRTQTVTAHEVELYAQITGDRNPLHFDADFAARTRFGRLVAQGASRRACSTHWSPWTCRGPAPCS